MGLLPLAPALEAVGAQSSSLARLWIEQAQGAAAMEAAGAGEVEAVLTGAAPASFVGPEHGVRIGGRDAFIGAVHRLAACRDGHVAVVAGALASTPEKSLASGRDLGLDPSRVYPDWQSMLAAETKLPRERRIDFVSIVTPNFMHHPIAKAFAEAGIHVVWDKPMVLTSAQARELCEITAARRVVFGVTYNYSGYPMVKQARDLVRNGELGDIRRVVVEYHQGWLATPLETSGQKQAG